MGCRGRVGRESSFGREAGDDPIKEKNAKTKNSSKELQKENPYCYSCDVSFLSQGALTDHNTQYQKVHTKVYRCRYCEVSSVGTRNFKDHLMSHKNEKMERLLSKSAAK